MKNTEEGKHLKGWEEQKFSSSYGDFKHLWMSLRYGMGWEHKFVSCHQIDIKIFPFFPGEKNT